VSRLDSALLLGRASAPVALALPSLFPLLGGGEGASVVPGVTTAGDAAVGVGSACSLGLFGAESAGGLSEEDPPNISDSLGLSCAKAIDAVLATTANTATHARFIATYFRAKLW